jgi:hypothetical protein
MPHFVFATESYPFTSDVLELLADPLDRAILLTKDVHHTMPTAQLRRFDQIVVVPTFDLPTLREALDRQVALEPESRIVSHDDFFYEIFAVLSEEKKLPGYTLESILPFVNKNVMKQRLLQSNV